jgi:hypothetical protein
MITPATFSAAQKVIGMRWKEDQSPDQAQILGLARDALDFISATGQRYHLEDFRASRVHAHPQDDSRFLPLEDLLRRSEAFFVTLSANESGSPWERELIQLIIDTLRFIVSTRQHEAFDEFRKHLESGAPPFVVASFDTREEAEDWLRNHPSPPDFAQLLIAGKYHDVIYDRETNLRRLTSNQTLQHYLAGLKPTEPAASFDTLEEASAWLKAQPKPARLASVLVGGVPYLAAYHSNINDRVLYPFSLAQEPGPGEG